MAVLLVISNVIFLILGYYLGNTKKISEDTQTIMSFINHQKKPSGTILHHPTAQQLREKGTPIGDTKIAMLELLQNDPFLNENNSRRI